MSDINDQRYKTNCRIRRDEVFNKTQKGIEKISKYKEKFCDELLEIILKLSEEQLGWFIRMLLIECMDEHDSTDVRMTVAQSLSIVDEMTKNPKFRDKVIRK